MLFEKFGEMNSAEEINELAKNLLAEGDIKSLKVMAAENGITSEYVEYFTSGEIPQLCDALDAAIGKLDVEALEIEAEGIMVDWVDYIKGQCMENELMTHQVRKKGKSLKGCIGKLLAWGFKHQKSVDKDIIKSAGVNASRVTFGMPGMAEAKKIIREYYLGGGADA